jgi:phenylacetate-CoA ligase
MLFGYPSAFAHIASYAKKCSILLNDIGIKVAFVTSERLYDHQRELIQEVFGCPVANGYGGRDAGFIAHECPQGGMHITAEDIIVEIVGAHGNVLPNGQAGEVVVTHLATRDYPFIRYRTGDIAVIDDKQCTCGRILPLLKEIQGRTTDFIVAKDGTVMHGLALIYVVRDVKGVQNCKVIQESIEKTRVLLVTNDQFQESSMELMRAGIKQRLGEDVEVEIERVNEIPLEASGKFRYVISHVAV